MKLREKFAAILALLGLGLIIGELLVLTIKFIGVLGLAVLLSGIVLIVIALEIQSGV